MYEYILVALVIGLLAGVRIGQEIQKHDIMTDERWTYNDGGNE